MSDDRQVIDDRFAFAMSSFGRMFRPPGITNEMKMMCKGWAEDTKRLTPMHDNLDGVDEYFLEMWKVYSQEL